MPQFFYRRFHLWAALALSLSLLSQTSQAEDATKINWLYITTVAPTTFTPPESCASATFWFSTTTRVPSTDSNSADFVDAELLMYKAGCLADINCCPEGYVLNDGDTDTDTPVPIYKPGVCPSGYINIGSNAGSESDEVSSTQFCCPSSLVPTIPHSAGCPSICASTSTEYGSTVTDDATLSYQTLHVVAATPIYVVPPPPSGLVAGDIVATNVIKTWALPNDMSVFASKNDYIILGLFLGMVFIGIVMFIYFSVSKHYSTRRQNQDNQNQSLTRLGPVNQGPQNQPQANQPQANQPQANQTQANQPQENQPQGNQAQEDRAPGEDQTEEDQAEGDQAEGDQADGDQAEGDQTEGDHAEGDQAEGDQTEGDHTEGDQVEGEQPPPRDPPGYRDLPAPDYHPTPGPDDVQNDTIDQINTQSQQMHFRGSPGQTRRRSRIAPPGGSFTR